MVSYAARTCVSNNNRNCIPKALHVFVIAAYIGSLDDVVAVRGWGLALHKGVAEGYYHGGVAVALAAGADCIMLRVDSSKATGTMS